MNIKVVVSLGELYDKISILEIKKENIKDSEKLKYINEELDQLRITLSELNKEFDSELYQKLKNINEILWKVEDDLREKERDKVFDNDFIESARMVYKTNDWRSEIKKEINIKHGSNIVEVKGYQQY